MSYAYSAWELAADTYRLKLQRLQNKVLRTNGNIPRCTPVHDLHTVSTFRMYMIIQRNCAGKKSEVIQNHENEHVRIIGQGEARHRKCKLFKLGGGQAYGRSNA
jgi:hypothetical protein